MDITRWSVLKSNCLYSLQPKMEKLYTVSINRLGTDCGSDYEFLIRKFRLKWKKVGKTIRPFRYYVNQIPYVYTVEVRNRFQELDLIDRVPEGLWTEVHDIVQEAVIKTISMKMKCKKAKLLSEETLYSCEKKRSKKQRSKWKIYPLECRTPKNSMEWYESLPQWSVQRNRGKQ